MRSYKWTRVFLLLSISIIVPLLWYCTLAQVHKAPFPTDQQLRSMQAHDAESSLRTIFNHINIPRQVDTPNLKIVGQYISKFLTDLGWKVEWDIFAKDTVAGHKTFRNIIATLGPADRKYLVLACHYETLPMEGFQGSIDSAMPCSIMLQLADMVTPIVQKHSSPSYSLRLVFLDGEEALHRWTEDDSLYGARHLAEKWSQPDHAKQTELSKIHLFVLLDLIGATETVIPNYVWNEPGSYGLLAKLEHSMRNRNLLRSQPGSHRSFFGSFTHQYLEDDHIPFYHRKVPILHLISYPFPPQWHKLFDNADHIDWAVSCDMLTLMNAFVQTYLQIL